MATEVDICNLALANLGDSATVVSISPPEVGSRQAELCARFYPLARDAVLAAHSWSFNTRRGHVVQLDEAPVVGWDFQFALPVDCLHVLAVLPDGGDADLNPRRTFDPTGARFPAMGPEAPWAGYSTQPFTVELGPNDQKVILTNFPTPVVRWRARVEDTTLYTPECVMAMSWLLASYLAGPIIKGSEGATMAQACQQFYAAFVGRASGRDAGQSQTGVYTTPSAIRARN
jgi:hypothetical protein